MLCDQLQQDVEALFRGERAVEVAIRLLRFLKRTENLDAHVILMHA